MTDGKGAKVAWGKGAAGAEEICDEKQGERAKVRALILIGKRRVEKE